jgi:NTP pyrophosphatase (non-canonical NTP hydrolase)
MGDFLDELRATNSARWLVWAEGREPDPLFMAVELGGEAGEALNEVKKLVREERGWPGSRTTVDKLADEIADVLICADFLAWAYGIDLRDAVTKKFNATSDKVGLPHMLAARAAPGAGVAGELLRTVGGANCPVDDFMAARA